MPYIIVTSLYPSDKATEVAKRYFEAMTKYPPDDSVGTRIVPAAVKTTLQGIKVIGITDVKEGKYEDALNRITNMMAMFLNIQGFEYTIDNYAKVEEALKTIGM